MHSFYPDDCCIEALILRGAIEVRRSQIINQNGLQATSGFEMCFAIGSQHLWCRVPTVPTKTRLKYSTHKSSNNILFVINAIIRKLFLFFYRPSSFLLETRHAPASSFWRALRMSQTHADLPTDTGTSLVVLA